MDLDELRGTLGDRSRQGLGRRAKLSTLYDLIYTLPKPTIAAVNGAAVAGGAGLVSVCDLARLRCRTRSSAIPEVRRGLVAAMVMPHLLRHVGERRRPLAVADRRTDRRRRGLADRVHQRGGVARAPVDAADSWAKSLAEGRAAGAGHRRRNCCDSSRGRRCRWRNWPRPAPNRG